MKITRTFLTLFLALGILSGLVACGDRSNGDSAGTGGGTSEESGYTGSLTVGTTQSVEGFDPGSSNNGTGMFLVYNSILKLDDEGELVGDLASSYEWVDDTHLKVVLKQGVTFGLTGNEATAGDVLWSLMYYQESGSNLSTYYDNYDWENTEIVDQNTLIFAYYQPYGPALKYLTLGKIQEEAYYKEHGNEAFWDAPNGTGPYICKENISGSHTTYELREDIDSYWGDVPEVERFVLNSYSEVTSMFIDFENGALDMVFNLDDNSYMQLETGIEGVTYKLQSANDTVMLVLNDDVEYWQDDNVRAAVGAAVDWYSVGSAAFGNLCTPATSVLSASVTYHKDLEGYTYNVDQAKAYMADSAYPNGFSVDVVLVSSTENENMMTAIQAYLNEIGITVNFRSYDVATAIPKFMAGETQLLLKTTQGGATVLEPDQILDTLKASSTLTSAAMDDQTFDSYLMEGLYTVDESKREALYHSAQEWLYENNWAFPVCDTAGAYAFKDYISFSSVSTLYPDLTYVHVS